MDASFLNSPTVAATLDFATIISVLLALFSTWVSARSIRDGKRATLELKNAVERLSTVENQLSSVSDKISKVADSVTTRRIGENPTYLKELTKLVSEAKRTVTITTVYHNVGVYAKPSEWQKLESVLAVKRSEGIQLRLLWCTRDRRRDALIRLYHEALDNWDNWSKENSTQLRLFIRNYRSISARHSRDGLSFSEFDDWIQCMLDVQESIVERLYYRENIEVTADFVSVITWLKDDDEAFFAIVNALGANTGFISRDPNIIHSFESVRELYVRRDDELNAI